MMSSLEVWLEIVMIDDRKKEGFQEGSSFIKICALTSSTCNSGIALKFIIMFFNSLILDCFLIASNHKVDSHPCNLSAYSDFPYSIELHSKKTNFML